MAKRTPTYDESLTAYQTVFASELNRSIDFLNLTKAMRVLDVPCGNGFYSRLVAQRLGSRGRLVAVDRCSAYLQQTRRRLRTATCSAAAVMADAYRLPFADGAFDLVWCAQSLISLNDALAALREMKRVVRPGGAIAILENDIFHHVLLPWPVRLEMPIQQAIQKISHARFGSSSKLAPARWIPVVFEEAGLKHFRKHSFVADRTTPWTPTVRKFLECHLRDISKLLRGALSAQIRRSWRSFANPQHASSLFNRGAKDITCLSEFVHHDDNAGVWPPFGDLFDVARTVRAGHSNS